MLIKAYKFLVYCTLEASAKYSFWPEILACNTLANKIPKTPK